jgi:hypothetical protein
VACRYGTDAVAPPGNQAANREHKQIPTVAGQTATEKRGEQTRAEGRGVGRWRREAQHDAAQTNGTFTSASNG